MNDINPNGTEQTLTVKIKKPLRPKIAPSIYSEVEPEYEAFVDGYAKAGRSTSTPVPSCESGQMVAEIGSTSLFSSDTTLVGRSLPPLCIIEYEYKRSFSRNELPAMLDEARKSLVEWWAKEQKEPVPPCVENPEETGHLEKAGDKMSNDEFGMKRDFFGDFGRPSGAGSVDYFSDFKVQIWKNPVNSEY